MKPDDLKSRRIKDTQINDYVINRLEIDLRHINYGLDENKNYHKKRRSSLSIENICEFFESLNEIELDFQSDDKFDYFMVEKLFFIPPKKYRMVFCIEKSLPSTSGIITMFQINKDDL